MRHALLLVGLAAAPAAAQDVGDALKVGDLICEFSNGYRHGLLADLAGEPRAADLLMVYESVQPDAAQVVSTQAPGRRSVTVRSTLRGVHFIERVGPSVRMTTLTGCEHRKWKNGAQTCVRFSAEHAWIIDTLAALDPDGALAQLPSGAAKGRCEPWQVD